MSEQKTAGINNAALEHWQLSDLQHLSKQDCFLDGVHWATLWLARAALSPKPDRPMLSDAQIRELCMQHGFTIKEGLSDLKPYVYAAVRACIRADREGQS